MTRLTLRSLWSHKWRSLLTALAVIFGITLVAGTYVLTDTTSRAFDRIFVASTAGTDVIVTARSEVEQRSGETPDLAASWLKKIRRVPGVAQADGAIFSTGAILDREGAGVGNGFAPQFIASRRPDPFGTLEYVAGHAPRGDRQVTLDESSAEQAEVKVGDTIQLVGVGRAIPFRVTGLTRLEGASFGGAALAQVTLPAAREVTGKRSRLDEIMVAAADGTSPEQLRQRVAEILPDSLLAETGQENAERNSSELREQLSFLTTALLAFAAIALFVGSFVIFNVFSITVTQRIREFGMLRTIGAGRRQVLGSVVLEGLLLGLFGAVAGLLVGVALAAGLQAVMKAAGAEMPANGLVVEPRTVIVSLVIGVGVTLAACLIPAVRATRVPPIAALLGWSPPAGRHRLALRVAISLLLAVAGVALILLVLLGGREGGAAAGMIGGGAVSLVLALAVFAPYIVRPAARLVGAPLEWAGGMTGRLARENSQRNPGRTAITAAALMIGLALIAFVTVFASGLSNSVDRVIDDSLPGEITLQGPGGFTPIPAGAVKAVAGMDGVEAASGIRYATVRIGGAPAVVSGVNPKTVSRVFTTEWEQGTDSDLATIGTDRVIVGGDLAARENLAVGDRLKMVTQRGDRLALTVAGIIKSGSLSLAGDAIVSQAVMAGRLGVPTDAVGLVKLAPGTDVKGFQKAVESRLAGPYPTVEVLNQDQLKQNQRQMINGLLSMIYVLLALAVIVSLVGIVVTLVLSIHERTRELGVLRAVGMSRRQVRRMIRYEAVITAVIGAVAGLALGVLFAFLVGIPLAGDGFDLAYPAGTLALILLLTALAGVLAAVYPARKASRLDVIEAISYE